MFSDVFNILGPVVAHPSFGSEFRLLIQTIDTSYAKTRTKRRSGGNVTKHFVKINYFRWQIYLKHGQSEKREFENQKI